MEYRGQKTVVRLSVLACLALVPVLAADLHWEVRRERALKDRRGVLTIDAEGASYSESGKIVRWQYEDIQQLWVSPRKLVLLTYKDRPWLLGIDKEFEFFLTVPGPTFEAAYPMLKDKLDQRFVAALVDPQSSALWQVPVKRLGALRGSEGLLQVGPERIVFKSDREGQSRTWRYGDIENVSTSGPFQLTLTTHERAKTHYGSMKAFNFQLKQRLDDKRFDLLWKRLNRDKGLRFLSSMHE